MPTTEDILDSIQNRLRQLNEEIDALHVARSTLGSDGSGGSTADPKRARSRAPKPARQARASAGAAARRRGRTSRRSQQPVSAAQLEAILAGQGGLGTSALAELANADRDQVLGLLRELEAAGRVRRTGQRRATRWHVITDEERIQQRVAELEAASRRAA